jgi:hypothetical protein
MTIDFLSGNVTKIKVKNQKFKVIKYKYQGMHPHFVIREEIGDSTNSMQRGRLANMPLECLHHQAVTGPVKDPLTSFHSYKKFVKVLLDCVCTKNAM